MPWIVDGNNLAGGRDRTKVRRAALALARAERVHLFVFFDGAPPAGSAPVERLGSVEIRYVPDADSAIVEFLGGRARGWRVATDDRGLAARVRGAGGEVVGAAVLWEKMAAAEAGAGEAGAGPPPSSEGYGTGVERLPQGAIRVPRRRGRRRRAGS